MTYNSLSLSLCAPSLFLPFSSHSGGCLHHGKKQKSSPFTLETRVKRKTLRAAEALGLISYSPKGLLLPNSGAFQRAEKGNFSVVHELLASCSSCGSREGVPKL